MVYVASSTGGDGYSFATGGAGDGFGGKGSGGGTGSGGVGLGGDGFSGMEPSLKESILLQWFAVNLINANKAADKIPIASVTSPPKEDPPSPVNSGSGLVRYFRSM